MDKALDKTDSARAEEVALYQSLQAPADPTHSKYHDPKQAEWIRRLFRGELADMKLTDLWSRLHSERLGLAADPAAQEAFARLVLHVEKYGHLLRPYHQRLGRGVHNTYIAAGSCSSTPRPLAATAGGLATRHQRGGSFVRSACWRR